MIQKVVKKPISRVMKPATMQYNQKKPAQPILKKQTVKQNPMARPIGLSEQVKAMKAQPMNMGNQISNGVIINVSTKRSNQSAVFPKANNQQYKSNHVSGKSSYSFVSFNNTNRKPVVDTNIAPVPIDVEDIKPVRVEVEEPFEIQDPAQTSITFFNQSCSMNSSITRIEDSRNINLSNLHCLLDTNCSGTTLSGDRYNTGGFRSAHRNSNKVNQHNQSRKSTGSGENELHYMSSTSLTKMTFDEKLGLRQKQRKAQERHQLWLKAKHDANNYLA